MAGISSPWSLLAADSAYAVSPSHGLLPAFGDMLDENVIFLEPGETLLFGKAATLERLSADPGSAAATETWRAVRVDVSADGRVGYTYGFGGVNGPFGQAACLDRGEWRYEINGGNGRPER